MTAEYPPQPQRPVEAEPVPPGSGAEPEPAFRTIRLSDIKACPFQIITGRHYRDDGTCRCDDPDHKIMAEWGYAWNEKAGRWE